jgi:hypothetical protein
LAVGSHQYYLNLGRYNAESRLIHFFHHPTQLSGTTLVQRLVDDGVIAQRSVVSDSDTQKQGPNIDKGKHKMALNFVTRWNTDEASVLVGLPVVLSLLIGIIWPIVASRVFGADVQLSTQTGFAVATYVITTGAVLIALVAFLDTQDQKIKES